MRLIKNYHTIQAEIILWMASNSLMLLRIALGIVFFWFGFLKFFNGLSPADEIAEKTIEKITFGLIKDNAAIHILAVWESIIGLGLITAKFLRITIGLLLLQMVGAFLPLILFINETWESFPLVPTLEGQYIIKNLVLVSSALVLGSTVKGARLIAGPEADLAAEKYNSRFLKTEKKIDSEKEVKDKIQDNTPD